ncbi:MULTISPECIES: MBL fold metallo-hydrolase [unclassified Paenibacillus]|uniref:MBL fold metallo-hydrolase n=1 Tax=unclassified Paenibacillus TaxID=185978 RepID=UPI002F3F10CC
MELWFLGTSAGMPIRGRNVTSVAIRINQNSGSFWMFDCGEGTQQQMLKTSLNLNRLMKLFITHLHGDHVYGIPGLLSSRSSFGCTESLEIYGPPGLCEYVETNLRITGTHLGYPIKIVEITIEDLADLEAESRSVFRHTDMAVELRPYII